MINGTFYEIGGGGMPNLNFTTPLFKFDNNKLTYTAIKDCYLIGTIYGDPSPNVDTTLQINNNVFAIGSVVPASSNDHVYISPLKLTSGDVVKLNQYANYTNLYILDTK